MVRMNRGLTASELIERLQKLMEQYGDIEVFKERNGSARPIYFAEYYKNCNRIELT